MAIDNPGVIDEAAMKQSSSKWVLVLAAVAIVLVYSVVCALFVPDGDTAVALNGLVDFLFFAGVVLLAALGVVAIVLHNSPARCNPLRERQVMLVIKLGLVPFFLFGGFLLYVMVLPPTTIYGIYMIVFLGAVGWLIMLPGSAWGICYALSMKKAGMISGGIAALFIVMQFFFVLDVVAVLVMFFLGRSREKTARAGV